MLLQQLSAEREPSSNNSSKARNLSTTRTRIRINDLPALRIEETPPTTGELLLLRLPLALVLPLPTKVVMSLLAARVLFPALVEDEEIEVPDEVEVNFHEEEADKAKGMEIDKIVHHPKAVLPPVRRSRVITKEVDIEEEVEEVEMVLEEDVELQEVDSEDKVERLVGLVAHQREQRHRLRVHRLLLLLLHLLPMLRTRSKRSRESGPFRRRSQCVLSADTKTTETGTTITIHQRETRKILILFCVALGGKLP